MVWQAGHLLNNGKYEILEVLGRGGFALTYKARNQDLDMEVVIKTPDILQKRDIEYEEYVKQFQAEGRKLAKFSETTHPHIVRVLYFFTEDQVPCLVMDFIQGQTLMEKVKAQGKLSEAECLKYIRQIGSALEAVHQTGMVHRDAHPGNIMIQPNGNAILIDFGIAKEIIPASSSSTNSGANFSFAPYEQIFEHLQSRDRALENITSNRQPNIDIYTLSATFYYAVTGQKPMPAFDRKSNNRLLIPPKEINRNLSEHLNTAITLGMALEKGDRPQSMSDWLQQLELPPPPVEPQYRQETVNPPRSVEPQYRQETVNPPRSVTPEKRPEAVKQKQKTNPQLFENSIQEKPKNIPWSLLIGVFLVYGLVGYILGVNLAPWQAVATVASAVHTVSVIVVAWVVAMAWVVTMAGPRAATWFVAVTVAFFVAARWLLEKDTSKDTWLGLFVMTFPGLIGGITFSLTSGNVLGGVVHGIGSIVIVFIQFATRLELDNTNFSPFNIFLILSGANLGGLGSGWLLAFLLHPKG